MYKIPKSKDSGNLIFFNLKHLFFLKTKHILLEYPEVQKGGCGTPSWLSWGRRWGLQSTGGSAGQERQGKPRGQEKQRGADGQGLGKAGGPRSLTACRLSKAPDAAPKTPSPTPCVQSWSLFHKSGLQSPLCTSLPHLRSDPSALLSWAGLATRLCPWPAAPGETGGYRPGSDPGPCLRSNNAGVGKKYGGFKNSGLEGALFSSLFSCFLLYMFSYDLYFF